MQSYQRIQNPWMPNGTSDKTNVPTLDNPGELGCCFSDINTGRVCLRVQLEAANTLAVAAGTLAFWKDRANGIVTATKANCDVGGTGSINRVAGIFQLVVTAGNYCDIIIQGLNVPLVSADNSGVAGGNALANTAGGVNNVIGAAAVTTAPVSQVIGVNRAIPANSVALVDVLLGYPI